MSTIAQEVVDAHARRTSSAVARAAELFSAEANFVADEVAAYLTNSLEIHQGVVARSGANSRVLSTVQDEYRKALCKSGYGAVAVAFSSVVIDQVGEFKEVLELAGLADEVEFTEDDLSTLSNHATSVARLLDAHAKKVENDLVRLLCMSLGVTDVGQLTKGISGVIRKLSEVKPIISNHIMSFYKLVGSLVYRKLESGGRSLRYRYVGPEAKRGFCKQLLGKDFSLAEVQVMENGQVPDVLSTGGGWGCAHWWAPEVR
jgi:hypothetical protein